MFNWKRVWITPTTCAILLFFACEAFAGDGSSSSTSASSSSFGLRNRQDTRHKGIYTGDINSAEVTVPRKVNRDGGHISYNVTHFHGSANGNEDGDGFRNLVSSSSSSDLLLHYNVTVANRHRVIVLEAASHFLAPNLVIERRRRDVHTRTYPKRTNVAKCHYQGIVQGHEDASRVALSTCNGLTGFIHVDGEQYFIEPKENHHPRVELDGHKHLIYKRSAVNQRQPSSSSSSTKKKIIGKKRNKKKKKKKKRHHSKNCGTREPKRLAESRLEWKKQIGKVRVQGKKHKPRPSNKMQKSKRKKLQPHQQQQQQLQQQKRQRYHHHNHHHNHNRNRQLDQHRSRRSISKPRYVEALLVADDSMMDFHQDGDVETYLLTIMNMVSSLYLDPTIGNLINVVVVRIILLEEALAEPDLNVTVNADVTLRNFCRWQKMYNPGNDTHPHHHDVAILVTRKDICARQDTPCNTLGVAHVAGMCHSDRSCSVNEDNGITLAHTITHEMGHNFGMYHDTDKIGCSRKEGNMLHVMTPTFEADTVGVNWSRCSRRDITNFLDQGLGECLQDEPQEREDYTYPELPAGAMYNADHQCRLQFGGDAQVCTSLADICSRLWCDHDGTCTTLLRPAAPGTHCGKHMWCQNLKCVPIAEPDQPIDGGWGDWSDWSPCSRTCGAGVSIMQRECDHPKPTAGGRFCIGERRRYRICNTDPCPEGEPTFRAVQCIAYNNRTHDGKMYEWVPYFDQDEPCELYCSDVNETVIVPWGEFALDGTPCNVGSRDVCISGICRKVGCDWVVDSLAEEDACGVCQGDGSKCETAEGLYTKQSNEPGYKEVITIPTGSRNIRVEEMEPSENYIGIGSAVNKKFYLNGKRHITLAGEYTIAGTQALYERENELEKIRIPGPIKEDISIYVIFRGKADNPGVKYQYTIAKRDPPQELHYHWSLGDWSPCSATCGGGTQHKRPICVNQSDTSTTVDLTLCPLDERPDQLMRACSTEACPTYWWIGPWQSCPVTCSAKGEKPMRRRTVMCVDGKEMALPDQYCENSIRPQEYEPCAHLPRCSQHR